MRTTEKRSVKVVLRTPLPSGPVGSFIDSIDDKAGSLRGRPNSPVKTIKGVTEYHFNAILAEGLQSEHPARVFSTSYLPLVQHFAAGGNSSVISYGQKGLGKSGYLTAAKGGLITDCLSYLFEVKKIGALELSILRISNLCVRLTHSGV